MSNTSDSPSKAAVNVPSNSIPAGRSSRGDWPFATTKIQPSHQERLAIVYVRQSSPQQVLEHRESAELQYDLARQAVTLGWPPERVLVIDEDQGQSAKSAEARQGFQQLLAEVSLDHVGLVLGIEMSRLARSCKDWYQLLEVCALFRTLLFDQDGLYDPTNYNDRLLLGLKGTMSEAELHILQGRLNQGRLNKARRGALLNHPVTGYIRVPGDRLALDPDEQVQTVVRLLLEKFAELGTVNRLLQYLVRHGIRLGIRPHCGANRGNVEWRRPCRETLLNILHHPCYAGAYSHGRRPVDPRRKIPGRPGTGRRVVSWEECEVLIRDHYPAYIPWEQFLANQQRLAENRARTESRGAPREGPALLAGLLVCGRCNHRMAVQYTGSPPRLSYACNRLQVDYGEPFCQSLAGKGLDELIAHQLLRVLEPATLELSLRAAEESQQERDRLHQHWQQRLERAGHESDRAARQYHAVEPENRLVARQLEHRWEESLREQRELQEAYDRFVREQPRQLTTTEREAIRALATDIPALWKATSTTATDRKAVVRHLVERVVVTVQGESELVDVSVEWVGGYASQHQLIRPVARYEQLHHYQELLTRAVQLRDEGHTTSEIAAQLNREGWRPPKRRATFNGPMVRAILSRRATPSPRPHGKEAGDLLGQHEWWFADLAGRLNMPHPTLYSWLRRGWVRARQLPGAQGRWILWADEDELDRLKRLRTCPHTWCDQPLFHRLIIPKPLAENK
jgi:DNA invertase Pin-like site-specific DNA recombinase